MVCLPSRQTSHLAKRHFLARNDAFWALIGRDLTHGSTCGLGKVYKKKRKKGSVKLAIYPDHTRCRIEVKVCMLGGLRCVVLSSFIKIGSVVLPLCTVENRPFPLLLPYKPWHDDTRDTLNLSYTRHHIHWCLHFCTCANKCIYYYALNMH